MTSSSWSHNSLYPGIRKILETYSFWIIGLSIIPTESPTGMFSANCTMYAQMATHQQNLNYWALKIVPRTNTCYTRVVRLSKTCAGHEVLFTEMNFVAIWEKSKGVIRKKEDILLSPMTKVPTPTETATSKTPSKTSPSVQIDTYLKYTCSSVACRTIRSQ